MKRFKFEMGGSYVFYHGNTLGEAIEAFIKHRASRMKEVLTITEEPIKDWELP